MSFGHVLQQQPRLRELIMNKRTMTTMGFLGAALFLAGCPIGESPQSYWCGGPGSTTGGTTTTSTTEDTTSTQPGNEGVCGECDDYTDCPLSLNTCRTFTCDKGRCVEHDLTPEHLCDSAYPCWEGACCFTCIADSGRDVGKMDVFDGPCVSGLNDHLCGVGGVLCEDCTLQGEVCVAGQCVKP
jgi:hypothetical protein